MALADDVEAVASTPEALAALDEEAVRDRGEEALAAPESPAAGCEAAARLLVDWLGAAEARRLLLPANLTTAATPTATPTDAVVRMGWLRMERTTEPTN